jgi:3-oxoacyl-(acyl-carrier-protein) synthase
MMDTPRDVAIAGMGLVTPLGSDLETVWQRLSKGDVADARPIVNPETGRVHEAYQVPPKLVESLGRNPRLRRSSAISYFAVSAGLAAMSDAGVQITPDVASRIAVVYAVSDGGVVYTRRLYEQIVKGGANTASPLLFPETVYNAPASHLAAQLGIDGMSYTLVGDASAGIAAVRLGHDLLATSDIDRVLVVAAEELDWILCDAYSDWRLARTPLSEGAAAVLLTRDGQVVVRTHGGLPLQKQSEASRLLQRTIDELPGADRAEILVSPENGTFIDRAIQSSFCTRTDLETLRPKEQLGEMLGASGLLQVVIGALALRHSNCRSAVTPVIGFNHQVDLALIQRVGDCPPARVKHTVDQPLSGTEDPSRDEK